MHAYYSIYSCIYYTYNYTKLCIYNYTKVQTLYLYVIIMNTNDVCLFFLYI